MACHSQNALLHLLVGIENHVLLTRDEMAQHLGINTKQVAAWRTAGLVRGHSCNEKDQYLYEDPGPEPPKKAKGVRLWKRARFENVSPRPSEVQCEA